MSMKHDNNKKLKSLVPQGFENFGGGLNRKKINDLAVYNIEQSIAQQKQMRLTQLAVHGLLCKPSVGCLLLQKSLISSKMASRIHYDLANTHNSFYSELGRSHNFFYVHFFFLFARQKEKTNQKRKTRLSKQTLMHLSSKFSNRFA